MGADVLEESDGGLAMRERPSLVKQHSIHLQ
jgi:hypothetical protein